MENRVDSIGAWFNRDSAIPPLHIPGTRTRRDTSRMCISIYPVGYVVLAVRSFSVIGFTNNLLTLALFLILTKLPSLLSTFIRPRYIKFHSVCSSHLVECFFCWIQSSPIDYMGRCFSFFFLFDHPEVFLSVLSISHFRFILHSRKLLRKRRFGACRFLNYVTEYLQWMLRLSLSLSILIFLPFLFIPTDCCLDVVFDAFPRNQFGGIRTRPKTI